MPIRTDLTRNGLRVHLPHGWGYWHVAMIDHAAQHELLEEAVLPEVSNIFSGVYIAYLMDRWWKVRRPWSDYTIRKEWLFEDPEDKEIFPLHPGDKFEAWR